MRFRNLAPYAATLFLALKAGNAYAADAAKIRALEEFASENRQTRHMVYVKDGEVGVVHYIAGLVTSPNGEPNIEILIAKEVINGNTNFIFAQRIDYNKIIAIRDNHSDGTANETKVRMVRSGAPIDSSIVAILDKPTINETDAKSVASGQRLLDITVERIYSLFIKN